MPMRLLALVLLILAPSACRRRQQPPASAGPLPMTEERKPSDFPPEVIEPPRDLEAGEGLPEDFKQAIEKRLGGKKKPADEKDQAPERP